MTIDAIKKKHHIPSNEQIYHISVPKLPHEMEEEGATETWEIYLREPTLQEEENLLTIMSTKILTATQIGLQSLYLEGDKEFFSNKNLIKSSMGFINEIFNTQEATIEKK